MSQILYTAIQTGNDNNAGTVDAPFKSFLFGMNRLGAGDTLLVGPGTYAEDINDVRIAGTSWSNKIRIASYPGASVWLKPNDVFYVMYMAKDQRYIEFDGINFDGLNAEFGGIKIEENSGGGNANHIRIQNAEIIANPNTPSQGIILDAGTVDFSVGGNELLNLVVHRVGGDDFCHGCYIKSGGNLLENLNVYDFPGAGLHFFNSHAAIVGNVVRGNIVYNGRRTAGGQRHWGILLADGSTSTLAANNIVYGIPNEGGNSGGVVLLFSGANNLVYNNTVFGNEGYGINVGNGDPTPFATEIKNNISYKNGTNFFDSGTSTVQSNNLFGVNPLFVNESAFDFRLQDGSPCIDAGLTL